MVKVMILDVQENIPQIIDQIFSEFNVNLQNKTVLIKPNIVGGFPPENGITTSPEVVSAIVKKCLAQGAAKVMVGDNPGGVETDSFSTAQKAGLVEASHGCFVRLSERVVNTPIQSKYIDYIPVSKAILDVDYLINVPVFKTHLLTLITGAMKNLFGYIAGGTKAKIHLKTFSRRRFSEFLTELYRVRIPDLNIMDGIRAMEGDGPTHGKVRQLNKILASTDAVALDATMARMMGLEPEKVHMLAIASERGLGKIKNDEINIIGQLKVIPDFILPSTFRSSSEEQEDALKKIVTLYPVLDQEKCIQCQDCEENCPAGAITLDPYPKINRDVCITCYCCAELCPVGAWEVTGVQKQFDRIFGN